MTQSAVRQELSQPRDSPVTGVYEGDARQLAYRLADLGAPSGPFLTATITSPPYGNLKDYGQGDQIGWAQTYEQYLGDCRDIFSTLFDRTLDHGALWLVADSLRTPVGKAGPWRLEPLPFQLANEAAKSGWMLRDIVIWRKDRSVPWSGRGRLRNVFEYILQLVKGDFKYHVDRIRNPTRLEEWWVRFPERYHPFGKVPPNVWDIPIPRQGAWKPTTAARHVCPLPSALVERIILLSTDVGDYVLDPFAGIGSVVAHAERLGRNGLGIESNPNFVKAYWEEVRPEVCSNPTTITDVDRVTIASDLATTLIALRILKYPRVLFEAIRPSIQTGNLIAPIAIGVTASQKRIAGPADDGSWATTNVLFIADGDQAQRHQLKEALEAASRRPPASKFGLRASLRVLKSENFSRTIGLKELYHYPNGRTWKCDGSLGPQEILETGKKNLAGSRPAIPPIVSNLYLSEDPRPIG